MTLDSLALSLDPFSDEENLVQLLKSKRCEGKVLEWKFEVPFGQSVSKRSKFRFVKAVVAFANTAGGFVVCGVDPQGNWNGITQQEAQKWDLADISNLVNSYVSPEIVELDATLIEHDARLFSILHVRKSPTCPHLCIKEEAEIGSGGKREVLLAKYAIYCRYGAACDLATPVQIERMIKERTDVLRHEILRRVREVEVPLSPVAHGSRNAKAKSTVVRVTNDPLAPEIRVSRTREEPATTVIHEQLSDGLFDDVNNVIQGALLMTKGTDVVVVPEHLYYRIYADRKDVQCSDDNLAALCTTALREYYPCAFWFVQLPLAKAASILTENIKILPALSLRTVFRLVLCAGDHEARQWLADFLEARWSRATQPPDIYHTFKKVLDHPSERHASLTALQLRSNSLLELPSKRKISVEEFLNDTALAEAELQNACLYVKRGETRWRSLCRQLDILAHSSELSIQLGGIVELLRDIESSPNSTPI